ncbi:MAG: protein phosphatase 2C domain-containing protein [Planctomycetota bacterium]|nr:protein phosphatase 2C domain-containing protein [Planctomycetota bacterium]
MSITAFGMSSVGRDRDNNEDRFLVNAGLGFYAIADGAGAGPGGEHAAGVAIAGAEAFLDGKRETLSAIRGQSGELQELRTLAREAVECAAARVNELTSENKLQFAATSLTMILVAGTHVAVAHVGDGRLYLYRDGKTHQLTDDHTIPAELARQGVIPQKNVNTHPFAKVLTRYLGSQESVIVDTLTFTALPEDRLLLCTNGASATVRDRGKLAGLFKDMAPRAMTEWIVEEGSKSLSGDDCTALALDFGNESDDSQDGLDSWVKVSHGVLKDSRLFEGLSFARRARILSHSKISVYEDGDALVEEGDVCSSLFIVLSGQLKLSAAGYDLRLVNAGGCLGESFLLEPRESRATVYAVGKAQVLELGSLKLFELCARRPRLGNLILKNLGRSLARRVYDLSGEEKDHELDL